jgi:hypothetical protein
MERGFDLLLTEGSACSREAGSQTPAREVEHGARSLCHRQQRHLFSEPVGAPARAVRERPLPPAFRYSLMRLVCLRGSARLLRPRRM